MMKKIMESAKSAVMLDGEISKCVDFLQGVAQRCTLITQFIQGPNQ